MFRKHFQEFFRILLERRLHFHQSSPFHFPANFEMNVMEVMGQAR